MNFFYSLLIGWTLFTLRQLLLPLIGSAADVFLLVPPLFIWLWHDQEMIGWLSLLSAVILIDNLLVRLWPFYTLASLSALLVYYVAVIPYVSANTAPMRFLMLFIWLLLWRFMYIIWLALGWLAGAEPVSLGWSFLSAIIVLLGWGLALAVVILGLRHLLFLLFNKTHLHTS